MRNKDKSQKNLSFRLIMAVITVLFGAGLFLFYFKYVPFVPEFQFFLLPVLVCVLTLTVFHLEIGILFFVFVFPLINSLPYFFGIQGNIPHAPTALVLFLFFFLGFLLRGAVFGHRITFNHRIFKPMGLFALLILLSAVITFLRYGQFFPFFSNSIYELTTNTKGVSAGGAIMSVVFTALNYLSGFAFFAILVNVLNSSRFFKRLISIFCLSTAISLSFGLFQLLFDKDLGNNLYSIQYGLINGTFKDSLSLSVFIVLVVPFLFSLSFRQERSVRLLSIYALISALVIIFFTGSKIGLVCVLLSLAFFIRLLFSIRKRTTENRMSHKLQIKIGVVVLIVLVAISATIFITTESDSNSGSTVSRIKYMVGQGVIELMYRWRVPLWRGAISMLNDYPLSGVGAGAYIIEIANYEQAFHWAETPQSAENYFLQIGAEFGLFGLILILLIFINIASAFRKQLSKIQKKDSFRFLLAGVGVGLFVYFINLLFHSYIGSYEVKYVFWLMAALVFTGLEEEKGLKESGKGKKIIKVGAILTVVLFSGLLLWNSTHSLSLERRTKELALMNHFGFFTQEKTPGGDTFAWTKKTAGLSVVVRKPFLHMKIQASHPDITANHVHLKISITQDSIKKRIPLDTVEIKNSDWQNKSYDLSGFKGQTVIVFFEVDRTWNPKQNLGVEDSRDLGIALRGFVLRDDYERPDVLEIGDSILLDPIDFTGTLERKSQYIIMSQNGAIQSDKIEFQQGRYIIRIISGGNKVLGETPRLKVYVGNFLIGDFFVSPDFDEKSFSFDHSEKEELRIKIEFINDYYDPQERLDRNVFIRSVEIERILE